MGFIQKLFGKNKVLEPMDLGILRTDVHSHLIPGIDDGSKDMDETLHMLEGFVRLGFKKVITTPHVMSDYYRNTPGIILDGLEKVREAIRIRGLNIEIEAAAEYYVDEEFEKIIQNRELLTFGDNYVLFELSFLAEPANLKDVMFEMQLAGYKPILAHPERYPYYSNDFEKYHGFLDKEVLLQINMGSLTGTYSPQAKKAAEKMIDLGMVSLVGSDCHHAGHLDMYDHTRRLPYFQKLARSGKLINSKL